MSQQQDLATQAAGAQEPQFAAFVAIDWADQKHVWAMRKAGSEQRETGELDNSPEAVDEWVRNLLARLNGRLVAVCLEQSRGALVCLLMNYPNLVLYPIHPATVKRFREALYPSGTKDDPLDADLQLELLLHHRGRLRAWKPDTAKKAQAADSGRAAARAGGPAHGREQPSQADIEAVLPAGRALVR